jgi:hypothetical protein
MFGHADIVLGLDWLTNVRQSLTQQLVHFLYYLDVACSFMSFGQLCPELAWRLLCLFGFLLICFAPAHCAPSARWFSLVFSGELACSIRAHACSSAVFTMCFFASLLHVVLLVLCMSVLYPWFLCSYVPVASLFALQQCTE